MASDLCILEDRPRPEIGWSADEGGFVSPLELKGRWYFRIDVPAEQVRPLFEKARILEEGRDTVLITEPITGTEAEALAKKLPVLTCLRVLD